MTKKKQIGVMLMTYGSPATLAEIPEFLTRIYGGRQPSEQVISKFHTRYELIGGSPLIAITQKQALALQKELIMQHPSGPLFQVEAGVRFSEPFIGEVIKKYPTATKQLIGIIMSPQFSPIIMSGYIKELEQAVAKLNKPKLKLKIAREWHLQPLFIQALTQKVQQELSKLPKNTSVLFSAHSMPKRVIEKEPGYIDSLKKTASAVAKEVGLAKNHWQFCYQSAGHTPEEWLKPDFADLMPLLKGKGNTHVLIAPVQFLADHLEVLYDIDIGAREQAEKHGIKFSRIQSLNDSPLFIKALAEVVKDNL